MRMRKRQFRIGELAEQLKIERFIVRFWEKEFGIKTARSQGRQRYYDEYDLKRFILIKELLYERGFTIAGAKKELEITKPGSRTSCLLPSKHNRDGDKKKVEDLQKQLKEQRKQFEQQIVTLKTQLSKLRELL